MALTASQKSDVRRHLKYPVAGLLRISPAGGTLAQGAVGYRFFENYGFLEYKMNNLNPDEEARLTGLAYGAIALTGQQPNPGDTMSAVFSGAGLDTPVTITVTAPGSNPPGNDARITVINLMAAAVAVNPDLQAISLVALSPFGTGAYSQNAVAVPEVGFNCPLAFTLQTSGTGAITPQLTATGAFLPPTTSLDGVTTIYGYIPILNGLEGAYASTSQNLDTIQADVWKGRSNEAGQRRSLYENWVQMMSDFLGTPVNTFAKQKPGNTGAIRYA